MGNPFDTPGMASGYATSRPPVHPRVIELVRPHLGGANIRRALDVGCGAGLSTRALTGLADELFGLEPAEGMLRWCNSIAPHARFVVGAAEALPFATGRFDLLTAAGSLNWVRLEEFFPEASRVLAPGGVLVVYDFSAGRSFSDSPALDHWFEAFRERYPPPASGARHLDPAVLEGSAPGFHLGAHQRFSIPITLAPDFYLSYILTETNVAAAVVRGTAFGEIRGWCARTLEPVWQGKLHSVVFRGYFACLHRKSCGGCEVSARNIRY